MDTQPQNDDDFRINRAYEGLAKNCFSKSVNSLMSHTLRAFEQFALDEYDVTLKLRLDVFPPRTKEKINKLSKEKQASRRAQMFPNAISPGVVDVRIYIHPEAGRTAARFAIAHELYHLASMLRRYKNSNYEIFPISCRSEMSNPEQFEEECHNFALRICQYFHALNTANHLSREFNGFDDAFLDVDIITGKEIDTLPKMMLNSEMPPCFSHTVDCEKIYEYIINKNREAYFPLVLTQSMLSGIKIRAQENSLTEHDWILKIINSAL